MVGVGGQTVAVPAGVQAVGIGGQDVWTTGQTVSFGVQRVGNAGQVVGTGGQTVSLGVHLVTSAGQLVATGGHTVSFVTQRVNAGGHVVATGGQIVAIAGHFVGNIAVVVGCGGVPDAAIACGATDKLNARPNKAATAIHLKLLCTILLTPSLKRRSPRREWPMALAKPSGRLRETKTHRGKNPVSALFTAPWPSGAATAMKFFQ